MDINKIEDIDSEPASILNKKRKRHKSKEKEQDETDSKISNNIKNKEIKNLITFPQKAQNNLYNTFSSKIDEVLVKTKIYTTSSQNKYNYYCQEINSGGNSIRINDAKILVLENKTLLFLLSYNSLYIYEIEENKYYEFIKEIPLNQQNNFIFSYDPTNLYIITPAEKKPRKNNVQQNANNNKKIRTKMVVYICIICCKEKYLCEFDLKKLIFKKLKNILPKKGIAQYLINNDMKYKLYQNYKILTYNNDCAYIQKLFGTKKFKNLKQHNIESISILNKNLFSICTPDIVYVYDSNNEVSLGEFKTHNRDKKARLIKPDNNLLMVYSSKDVSFYDLESLMYFQKLELNDIINNTAETIKKAKQLNNNNIAILFFSFFAIYNLEKNAITFRCDYWNNNNQFNMNGVLMEINPNIVLINNDEKNFYIMNSIKGDKIGSLNINNSNFSLCKKIKKYNFKYGVTQDKSIEEDKNDKSKNYVLINNSQNTFIFNSILDDKI